MSQKAPGRADGSTEDDGKEFSCPACEEEFDHYKGMFIHYGKKHDDDSHIKEWMVECLQSVARELGKTPTLEDIRGRDDMPAGKAYWNHFGTWTNACESAGLEPNTNGQHSPSKQELIQELQDAADELGRTPTQNEFGDVANYSTRPLADRFGNYNNALKAAGLELNRVHSINRCDLIQEIEKIASELGRAPFLLEAGRLGEYAVTSYQREFGVWENALSECGLEPPSRTGELNGAWKGGWDNYYGKDWREMRAKALDRDNHECVICDKGKNEIGKEPSVHHIFPARTFDDQNESNTLRNLVTFCPKHHQKWEGLYLRPDTR